MNDISITRLKEGERSDLIALLREANLPISDLPENPEHFFLARKEERVIGSIGLEVYAPYALLRSMVVIRGLQGEGIGRSMLNHLLTYVSSQDLGIKAIYLITESAGRFFESAGFSYVERATVPEAIKALPQFKSLCPSSAAVMRIGVGKGKDTSENAYGSI